jgi:hypothetical protein
MLELSGNDPRGGDVAAAHEDVHLGALREHAPRLPRLRRNRKPAGAVERFVPATGLPRDQRPRDVERLAEGSTSERVPNPFRFRDHG